MSAISAQAQLAWGPWAMFMRNQAHVGRSSYLGPGSPNPPAWRFLLPVGCVLESPAIGPDGAIYLGNGHFIFAIRPDGSEKWRFSTGGGTSGGAPALDQDGTLYMPSGSASFHALLPNGAEKWRYYSTAGTYSYCSPAVGPNGAIYIGCGLDLLALRPTNGAEAWRYRVGEYIFASPAVGADGTIYARSIMNFLVAVNPNGTQKWTLNLGGGYGSSVNTGSPVIAPDGTIYTYGMATPTARGLIALNPNGTTKWSLAGVADGFSTPCLASDGTIITMALSAGGNHKLYAVTPAGVLKWTFPFPGYAGPYQASPVIDASDVIYIPYQNFLYAINPDGTERWRYQGTFTLGQPALGFDGALYCGSSDGYLNAFVSEPRRYISLNEALDTFSLVFTTGGAKPWFGQADTFIFDGDAAQSGPIADGQTSWLQTTVTGPATVAFYWKVDSEEGHDFLQFSLNGEPTDQISGATAWILKSFEIGEGAHTLRWEYVKDGSAAVGSDCGWVDRLWVFRPQPPGQAYRALSPIYPLLFE